MEHKAIACALYQSRSVLEESTVRVSHAYMVHRSMHTLNIGTYTRQDIHPKHPISPPSLKSSPKTPI